MLDLTYSLVFLIAASMFILFIVFLVFRFIRGLFKAYFRHKHKFEQYSNYDPAAARSDLNMNIDSLLNSLDREESDLYYKLALSHLVDIYNYKRYLLTATEESE